jgi:hypothetical protein
MFFLSSLIESPNQRHPVSLDLSVGRSDHENPGHLLRGNSEKPHELVRLVNLLMMITYASHEKRTSHTCRDYLRGKGKEMLVPLARFYRSTAQYYLTS